MYFVLAGVIGKCHLLTYGLKMLLALMVGSVLGSLAITPKGPAERPAVGNGASEVT